ncbi:uncharacterized protein EV422DRAFT_271857 [Fimicolochytrium jonesii]|uniref:uncharacterized protein n=1 Tax=Fimicolochytrium jonesii TaxID=1396493 RepID=UPI0022FF241C|nr:uncharacterized protein EV422DRAFT_271857 [Fimicolochytrium jonesii]KAI8816838.1 hypothetical protein EV422DRAFT_271857 [Fimicolochytrium jonesii]
MVQRATRRDSLSSIDSGGRYAQRRGERDKDVSPGVVRSEYKPVKSRPLRPPPSPSHSHASSSHHNAKPARTASKSKSKPTSQSPARQHSFRRFDPTEYIRARTSQLDERRARSRERIEGGMFGRQASADSVGSTRSGAGSRDRARREPAGLGIGAGKSGRRSASATSLDNEVLRRVLDGRYGYDETRKSSGTRRVRDRESSAGARRGYEGSPHPPPPLGRTGKAARKPSSPSTRAYPPPVHDSTAYPSRHRDGDQHRHTRPTQRRREYNSADDDDDVGDGGFTDANTDASDPAIESIDRRLEVLYDAILKVQGVAGPGGAARRRG